MKAYRANRIGPHDGHKRAPSRRVQIIEVTYLRTGDAGPAGTLRRGLENVSRTGSIAAHPLEEAGFVHDEQPSLPCSLGRVREAGLGGSGWPGVLGQTPSPAGGPPEDWCSRRTCVRCAGR
jgi:hypothetical protein